MADATSPEHYQFGGNQLIDITRHLSGCGAQATQYVVRATRMDGKNKGKTVRERVEDLEKSKVFIDAEIERLSAVQDAFGVDLETRRDLVERAKKASIDVRGTAGGSGGYFINGRLYTSGGPLG
ncbi:hypothetical protein [Mycobacteroides immunogenum]|uniref:hypothetical protein n=1 Tax=Mycobacteroides immunogenum TaxID=83262 RepID=UPI0018E3921E|nr:hypothetical protein [Mycobacteroides immunogenum]